MNQFNQRIDDEENKKWSNIRRRRHHKKQRKKCIKIVNGQTTTGKWNQYLHCKYWTMIIVIELFISSSTKHIIW